MSDTLDRWKARAAAVERNRESFPLAGRMVDELKAEGFKPRVLHAREGWREVGAAGPEGVVAVVGPKKGAA